MNWPTLIVLLIVAAILIAVIVKMVRDKKNGKSSCGCGCGCGGCTACKPEKKSEGDK